MQDSYALSKGKRGAVVTAAAGKEKITIRLDSEIVNWFRNVVDSAGGGNYQTLMNQALHEYIEGKTPKMEDTFRRILREELSAKHDAA